MAWTELRIATRYLRRQFEKGVGKSLPKILTELITNSDDSYRRLESEAQKVSPIIVTVDRAQRRITVTDQAEGLNAEEMDAAFIPYGSESSDRRKGFMTRSLFGKGLRDVLFTQKVSNVKSIKDGQSFIAEFRWKSRGGEEDRPCVGVKRGPKVDEELRKAWGIEGNGTRVEFRLQDDVSLPQHHVLVERLCNFYMLRLINQNLRRRTIVRSMYPRERTEESELKFAPAAGNMIEESNFEISYEEYQPIKGEVAIYKAPEPLIQAEHGYEERQGGLLAIDEDGNVLDLTLFRFDRDPVAARFHGLIRLKGIGKIIRDKLNLTKPEEVLTETRDGFNRSHKLSQLVAEKIEAILKPIVDREREQEELTTSPLAERLRKQHKKAFDALSDLFQKLVRQRGEGPGPAGGQVRLPETIAFTASQITLRARTSRPVQLLINAQTVPHGSVVTLDSSHSEILVRPTSFAVDTSRQKDGLVTKLIVVQGNLAGMSGKITATSGASRAEVNVFVTDREVYTPSTGLGFSPDFVTVAPGRHRMLRLYADMTRLSQHEVAVTSDNLNIVLKKRSFDFRNAETLSPQISVLEIPVFGVGVGNIGVITASCGNLNAIARVKVTARKEPDRRGGPIINGYKFRVLSQPVQTMWEPDTGYIIINLKDPVNNRYFSENPEYAVAENRHCQVRLADLILDEALQVMVSQAIENGGLERRFPNNPEIDIRNYVCEYKYQIGPDIHRSFVSEET